MRLKISLLLLAASALAVVAGFVTFIYLGAVNDELTRNRAALAAYGDLVSAPVPKADAARGARLTAADFDIQPLPQSYLPQLTLEALPALAEGEVWEVVAPLRAGQLLSVTDLARTTADRAPEAPLQLADGTTAASFEIANWPSMADEVALGAKLDLFVLSGAENAPVLRLLSSNIVLAGLPEAGPAGAPSVLGPQRVLLSGTHVEIARLLLAQPTGQFFATLSSGPRPIDAGVVLLGAEELAELPLALRAVQGRGTSVHAIEVTPSGGAAPSLSGVQALTGGGGGGCTTVVVRASQRQSVDVPC